MKPIIPDAALQQHIAVLGKTRSGKSSVLRGLVEGLLDREQPVCIIDPKGDWWGIKLARDGKRPGYPVVIFGGEHADVPINEHSGAHVAELFATGNRPCLIDLGGWMVAPRTRFYIDFASTLFKLTKGMRWLVVDEVHNFAPKGRIFEGDMAKALHWTNRLASEGLGKGLPMLFASQRPQKVHNDTLTSAETLIAMRVLHPSDREAVSDWIKGCGDAALGAKVLGSLAQLARGEGWAWSPEYGFGPERVKFPMFKTYDSFRPQTAEDAAALKGWAEVNLDDVKAKLAAVVKEAEANDPKLLRAELAAAQRQLSEKSKSAVSAPTTKTSGPRREDLATIAALRKALENAMKFIVEINAKGFFDAADGKVDKAAVEKAIIGATQAVASIVERHVEQRNKELAKLRDQGDRVVKALQAVLESDVTVSVDVRHNEPFSVSPAPPRPREAIPRASTGTGDGALAKAERLILTALAQYPDGRTSVQVAVLTGYAHGGGGFRNAVGALRTAGRLDGGNERLLITQAGLDALGTYTPLPTGRALLEHWMRDLPKAECKALEAIANAYPRSLSPQQVANLAGYEAEGGGFRNALGRLRTLELIKGTREITASENLFDG